MTTEMTIEKQDQLTYLDKINGDAKGKSLLSMLQLDDSDIHDYINEAMAAESILRDPSRRGVLLLPHFVLKAVMRQPSTRTGGSMTTAMEKLGGSAQLISGMGSSSEAKGESLADSWVAFATQADILGIRTAEDKGPAFAAQAIAAAANHGDLMNFVPIINLGDGRNEHPTQALGDMYTIYKEFGSFDGLTATVVGDQERYRAHHSFMLGAAALGMSIIAVESPSAPVPPSLVERLGDKLTRTDDMDEAMRAADVLYIGRNPDEYDGSDSQEKARSTRLALDYASWIVDHDRIQKMSPDSIILHPRPRRDELHPSVDTDPRMKDVAQMANMIPMRMAIIARHLGKSIVGAL
jgi:aspartate carbamoyltransferase catalytic subunit